MDRRYDACVVGSGASGAIVAARLARAGWDVVLIEQGRHTAPGTSLRDLIPGFETARARTPDGEWVEHGYPWTACTVGGGTRFYAGISLRMRPVDFDAGDHVVPEALPPAWPFQYEQLRADYQEVERWVGVSASPGDPSLPDTGRGALPPQPPSPAGRLLSEAARRRGLHPFPVPLAINSVPFAGEPACRDLTACTDHVCPIGAKGDVFRRILAPALAGGNLTLRSGWKAVRLRESAPGQVAAVDCLRPSSHDHATIRAARFVVAANAVQTAALLLRSRGRHSPRGFGNHRDLVGRGLCFKVGQNVRGTLPYPNGERRSTGRYSTVAITDYYLLDECPTGLGGLLLETNDPDQPDRSRTLRLECLLADQPLWTNQVRLDWSARDRLGLPRVVMDYRPHPVDLRRLDLLRRRAAGLLRAAGAGQIRAEPLDFTLGSAHLHGTCRMGSDPRSAVCGPDGRVLTADNVYVADGSLMPYPGAVNPTLTIQAMANRVARAIIQAGR